MVLYLVNERVDEKGTPSGSASEIEATLTELDLVIDQVEYLSVAMERICVDREAPKIHPYV